MPFAGTYNLSGNLSKLNDKHSPLGGSKKEYLTYFTPHFDLHTMESSNKSIQN